MADTVDKSTPKDKLNLPPDWERKALALYSLGAHDIEVRTNVLRVCKATFYNYMSTSAEFEEVIEHGRECAQAWWLKHGREQLENKDFQTPLWFKNMSNRYGWGDKQQTEVTGKGGKELVWNINVVSASDA